MGQGPNGYGGQGFSLRGEKGRFVLPPSFRKVFSEKGDERILCIAKHEKYPCLTGFGLSRTAKFESMLDKEEDAAIRRNVEFDRDLRSMQLWGFAELGFDASGRFILPDHLSELGGFDGAIYFQGGGDFLTMWDPSRLYAMGAGWEGAQATCRSLESDAKGKAKRK